MRSLRFKPHMGNAFPQSLVKFLSPFFSFCKLVVVVLNSVQRMHCKLPRGAAKSV